MPSTRRSATSKARCHSATCQSGVTNSPFGFGGSRKPEPNAAYGTLCAGELLARTLWQRLEATDGSARKATRTAHPRPYLVNYKCTYGETVGRMLGACGETAVGRKADLGSEWL